LYLEKEYGIAGRYILAGHSAGATMAFQLHNSYLMDATLPIPVCVIGIAGIYHFKDFVEAHKEISAYKELMENAFPDHSVWDDASPPITQRGLALWEQAKVIVISHSDDDGLVEKGQASTMIKRAHSIAQAKERVHQLGITGTHDEVWINGEILGGLILRSMDLLQA
jgi:kynurenine formamidase